MEMWKAVQGEIIIISLGLSIHFENLEIGYMLFKKQLPISNLNCERYWGLHFNSPIIFFLPIIPKIKDNMNLDSTKKNENKQNNLTVQSKIVLPFILGKINFGRIEE